MDVKNFFALLKEVVLIEATMELRGLGECTISWVTEGVYGRDSAKATAFGQI